MNYGNIKYCDIANGPGVRTTLFVSGCTHRCEGCFQPETWSFAFGEKFTSDAADAVIESLKPGYVQGLTILGGEPMEPANQKGLAPLLARVRRECPGKDVWVYTGDTIEDLLFGSRHTEDTDALLEHIDVLVDGPFVQELKSIGLRFRGSSNQRIIDVPATLASKQVEFWKDDPQYAVHDMV
ncbi:anaerobic ribonucleoside-triphosphate reductase activating protein [Curtanaerobium respiraculi]|uniref:anaerobic ribonucleoside-triphosphate reductase activating protein n=1 Tax=Curtanaerobium respiraculi TaxID=2949669 RepID=UPI0024B3B812|nr:anaerobic ribonucleoside-triphosphate reductase activating protein [Curtanaerobium respiraculi]